MFIFFLTALIIVCFFQFKVKLKWLKNQGRSETPSNQAFERVKFITIVNPSDKFFDVNFFILENFIPQMPLSMIYQTCVLLMVNKTQRNLLFLKI